MSDLLRSIASTLSGKHFYELSAEGQSIASMPIVSGLLKLSNRGDLLI